ncbi:MAG: 4-hydroxybenzoate octaprenyltransferase [Alphaproteobacteria bacterium]|nr:4-hydroxybenzoate octaprenyltransferase [Alphaproteobacteria bacterium]
MAGYSSRRRALAPHTGPQPAGGEREGPAQWEGEKRPDARADRSDIHQGDWVERLLPKRLRPYARLARLDRPIGTWLLMFPGWWGISLASPLWPDAILLLLFAIGAVAMRGAGCTLNDIADRDYDGQVARTRMRPLPSGAVSVRQAVVFLLLQLTIGAVVLSSLNLTTILLGAAVLGLIGTYPFMKRITYWPQVFLGLNFNWGALIGWTAVTGALAWPPLLLYVGGVFWTVGYDTIYAHQDKEDDIRIGVKSSAIALGVHTRPWVFVFYGAALLMWGVAGHAAGIGAMYWVGLAAAAAQLAWQAARLATEDPADCLHKFRSNRAVGWLLLAGIVAGHFV